MFDHPTPGAGFSQGLRRPPSRTSARRNARKRMASRTISVRMPRKLPPEPRLESPGRNRDGSRPAARVGRGSGAPRKQSPNRNPPAGRIHADRHPAAMPGLAERGPFRRKLAKAKSQLRLPKIHSCSPSRRPARPSSGFRAWTLPFRRRSAVPCSMSACASPPSSLGRRPFDCEGRPPRWLRPEPCEAGLPPPDAHAVSGNRPRASVSLTRKRRGSVPYSACPLPAALQRPSRRPSGRTGDAGPAALRRRGGRPHRKSRHARGPCPRPWTATSFLRSPYPRRHPAPDVLAKRLPAALRRRNAGATGLRTPAGRVLPCAHRVSRRCHALYVGKRRRRRDPFRPVRAGRRPRARGKRIDDSRRRALRRVIEEPPQPPAVDHDRVRPGRPQGERTPAAGVRDRES